ncbi:MAG: glycosyltransferase family 4 protein [Rhodothermales bacterium]|nr:glycosyltransferase family 4 protein [Rhodothermales bacterium]
MKLTFVTHSFPPKDRPLASIGGMQRVALELDEELARREDIEYRSLALRSSWKWVHVRTPLFLVGLVFRLRRMIRRGETDVILFSSMVTASLAVFLRGTLDRYGVRAAAIVHGLDVTFPNPIYQRWVPRVLRALDLVMPVSEATGEVCTARGLDPAALRVVHNGVDVRRFEASITDEVRESARSYRADLPTEPGAPPPLLLASIGRQVERKGFTWFIERVMPGLPGHIHYAMAGDGPEADAIERAIDSRGLAGRVRRLGRISEADLLALCVAADLFVMPNIPVSGDMEGFGIVMLEAGMCGTPTIAARLEGIREVVEGGRNGYFVEPGDADGYIRRITELDADRDTLSRLSDSTRRHVRETFGWEKVASNYVDALRKLSARDR